MNTQNVELAARIKDLREFNDMSAEELALKAGISLPEYEEIENAAIEISIGKIYNIAAALDIDPTVLLGGSSGESRECAVVYEGKGMKIDRYTGYSFTSLASKFTGREMEPMIVEIESNVQPELVTHTGEEFNYVLEGKLRILVGDKEYYLRAGDSIYFNPNLPHAQVAMDKKARFLTVILER